jgi:hypothetical protein
LPHFLFSSLPFLFPLGVLLIYFTSAVSFSFSISLISLVGEDGRAEKSDSALREQRDVTMSRLLNNHMAIPNLEGEKCYVTRPFWRPQGWKLCGRKYKSDMRYSGVGITSSRI